MLTFLLILVGIISYCGAGAWTFGYVRGAINDNQNGWASPLPSSAAIFWPFALFGIFLTKVMIPMQTLGHAFQQRKLKKQKIRIAEQEKLRIELAEAEKILEEEFEQLEEAEDERTRHTRALAKQIDERFFGKTKRK